MRPLNPKIGRFFVLLTFLLSIATAGVGIAFCIEEAYLQATTGGRVDRAIWFVHPTSDQPAIAVVQDHYTATDAAEEFTLVVHGLGTMGITSRGATWQQAGGAVQVELIGNVASIEGASGFNAETDRFEPYLKAKLGDKGEARLTWLAIGIENASEPCPVTLVSDREILVNNTLRLHVPGAAGQTLTINTTYHPSPHFQFQGSILMEREGTGAFVAGANIVNITSGVATSQVETFESVGGSKWMAETETAEQQAASSRMTVPLASEASISASLASLPAGTPFLFSNASELPALQARYNASAPGIDGALSTKLNSDAVTALGHDLSDTSIASVMKRSSRALSLAFDAWLTQNTTRADAVVKFLLLVHDHINRIDEDPKYLHHGINLANYVLAWDFIEGLVSAENNTAIRGEISAYALFVGDYLPGCGDNNWELVVSSGAGLAGLKLKDAALVRATLEKTDHYLRENVKLEGGIYEGQGYIGYAFSSHKRFLITLARFAGLGFPNYFVDDRFHSVYRFSARCATPDGYFPLFEDAASETSGAQNAMILAPFFARTGGTGGDELAQELMWLYYKRYSNTTATSPIEHFLFGNHSIVPREPVLDAKVSPHPAYSGCSYVAPASGLVMLRTEWGDNASYLTATAKTYEQSHVHKDELCFEFWANGTKHLTMPGYPGWGFEHHDWTQTTAASNGGVLFDGEGQTGEYCRTGLVQWLRGRRVDYVEMAGDGIYDPKHNFLFDSEYVWILPIGFAVCGVITVLDVFLWKRKPRA
ncbi:MAG: heparinase II/III family protein [Candidatus Lokiarchaeota archaeon]|nr:heparinase II/III family protein [Candidatus Lokiarchaeota archaeon]